MTLLMRDQENLEKGMEQERKKAIVKMAQLGYTINQIMAVYDITEEEVKKYIEDAE